MEMFIGIGVFVVVLIQIVGVLDFAGLFKEKPDNNHD